MSASWWHHLGAPRENRNDRSADPWEGAEMPIEIAPGEPAPEIDLPDDEGHRWRLSEHHGRPVVLIFHRHLA